MAFSTTKCPYCPAIVEVEIKTGKAVSYKHPEPICEQWIVYQETSNSRPPLSKNATAKDASREKRHQAIKVNPEDITNKFLVSINGFGQIVIQRTLVAPINRKDALILAAWLVIIADRNDEFKRILRTIQTT